MFSCGWRHNWGTFTHFDRGYGNLGANTKSQFLTQFVLEPTLQCESLETLIGFLAFLVPKVRPKNKHLVNNQVPQKVMLTSFVEGHNSPADWARELFKPSEDTENLVLLIEIMGSLGFELFVSDVILGVGLGFFGLCHQALGPNSEGQFFVCFFLNTPGDNPEIRIFKALDWSTSVSSLEVMPKNNKLCKESPRGLSYC